MKLVRNENEDGIGKYALIEREKNNHIEHGYPNTENEFFVLKLKDIHSRVALLAYSESLYRHKQDEFAKEIRELADRAGTYSKWCKEPNYYNKP